FRARRGMQGIDARVGRNRRSALQHLMGERSTGQAALSEQPSIKEKGKGARNPGRRGGFEWKRLAFSQSRPINPPLVGSTKYPASTTCRVLSTSPPSWALPTGWEKLLLRWMKSRKRR